ncbi:N-acetylneuraminate synthase family protein [Candidatus Woesearchaeota archaeon]|nr:N-acetylneuraminate synthase family protein [Candidatus Woesearchaeota archaeon]MCF8013128.1 N-acetylneuraminate synthase family protein [Candidatus Woesearchaeota archaeon]
MKQIILGNKIITDTSKPFFIAEIGINHNGSLETAKKMIDMACMLGADAVKFQKRTPEICVPKEQRNRLRDTPWGEMTYFDYKKKIEFEETEYKEIDRYCKEKKILWTASAWDVPSFEFLEKFDVSFHKFASAKITDKELLERVKATKKPVILSTGGTNLEQIKKAVKIFEGNNDVAILHCNSGYPAKDEELNLKVIQTLQKEFPNNIIGYSGHEEGITASVVATTLGAKIIERHITIDRAMWGTDQAASIEYDGLRKLLRDINKVDIWLGNGKKEVYETEKKVMEKLRDKNTL